MADLGSNGFTPEPIPYPHSTTAPSSVLTKNALSPNIVVPVFGGSLTATILAFNNVHPKLATKSGRVIYKLSGTAKQDNIATAGLQVMAFSRTTGALLGNVQSGVAGAFEIDIPGYDGSDLALVVALVDEASPNYNAVVKDMIRSVLVT